MTKANKLKKAGRTILDVVGDEYSVYAKSLSSRNAENVPKNVAPDIDKYLKNNPHEVYGSLAMSTHTGLSRTPSDIDMVVLNPRRTANVMAAKMRRKGYKTKTTSNPAFGQYVVQIKKNGEWVDVADIHPIKGHRGKFDVYGSSLNPIEKDGMNIQRAADQLLRKGNAVMGKNNNGSFGPAPHRALKDTADFVTTSRLLIDSKELQAKAELRRVRKARKALKVWKKHVRNMDGYNKDLKVGRDPIPDKDEREFMEFAAENPKHDIDNIVLGKKPGIMNRDVKQTARHGHSHNPYNERVADPYARNPYTRKRANNPYTGKKDFFDDMFGSSGEGDMFDSVSNLEGWGKSKKRPSIHL